MLDIDSGECVCCLPPTFEFKVRYKSPEHIKNKEEERCKQIEQIDLLAKKKQEEKESANLRAELKSKESKEKEERRVLAMLLVKYPDVVGVPGEHPYLLE